MFAYIYVSKGNFELVEKQKPKLLDSRDEGGWFNW